MVVIVVQREAQLLQIVAHCACRAASRTACTAGSSNAIRIPMIVMTTNNSMSVNALERRR